MGRLAVRLAIQSALQAGNLTYVGTVFPARPTIMDEEAYYQTMSGTATQESAAGSSCVVVVNLPGQDKRMRRADTGRSAVNDTNIHPVVLELFFASSGGEAIAAQQDYDAVVDSIVTFVRNNQTMSAPATVWSAGEYTAGVTHNQSQPYTSADGLTILIDGTVRFDAWEWIVGSGV